MMETYQDQFENFIMIIILSIIVSPIFRGLIWTNWLLDKSDYYFNSIMLILTISPPALIQVSIFV